MNYDYGTNLKKVEVEKMMKWQVRRDFSRQKLHRMYTAACRLYAEPLIRMSSDNNRRKL